MLRGALETSSGLISLPCAPWDKEWASVTWKVHAAFPDEPSAQKTIKGKRNRICLPF